MKKILILIIAVFQNGALLAKLTPPTFTVSITRPAYQESVTVRVSGVTQAGDALSLSGNQKTSQRNYVDGLGRPLQEQRPDQGNSTLADLVSFHVYDAQGREKKQHQPYAVNTSRQYQPGAVAAQTAFYATTNPSGKYAKDSAPYAESVFDNSPLNNVLQQGSAGSDWQIATGKIKSIVNRTNTAADNVRNFNGDGTSAGFYAVGLLSVSQTTDEEGHQQLTFMDKAGRVILKREWVDETIQGSYEDYKSTYFIYHDVSGLLMMVLPPKVADRMAGNGWVLSSDDLNNNIYRYDYDVDGRLTGKKLPSMGWFYMVYDKLNRLCMTQTALQRATNKWMFIKYDQLGRKILSGILQDNTHTTRTTMQAYCDSYDYLNPAVPCYETRGGTVMNYTDLSFPVSTAFAAFTPISVAYYDGYDLDGNGTPNYSYAAQSLGIDEPIIGTAQGQLAVVMSRKLGTSDWLTNVYFYDQKGRVVQQQSNNTTNTALVDVKTNILDFAGGLLRSIRKKTVNGTQHIVDETMTYDNGARLASVSHKYNSNAAVTLGEYVYNELGQLVDKNLGKISAGNYLQSLDLRYNIRGWLTGLNNASLSNDGYTTETNDVFGMEILYQGSDAIGNTGLYNGQISGVKWKMKMASHPFDNVARAYTYGYDKLGQLRNAIFKGNNGSGWTYRNDAYSEKNISYDLNGNLLALERNMLNISTGSNVQMDKLTYSYKPAGGSDQLQQITDAYGAAGSYGFKNQSSDPEHYLYDGSGNLIQDKNKNLSYSYNDLGKVNRVTLLSFTNRYIQYNYDGFGTCLSKQVVDNGSTVKTTSYMDGFVAVDNVLSYVQTAEGRVRTASGVGTYEYYIKDHLGNIRVSFENIGGVATVRQENSYYTFGLVHNGTVVPSGANKQLVANGEWENDFGNDPDLYTMPYRQYDPVIGRFNAVDPLGEKFTTLSVYHFGFNNPVSFSDPSGAAPIGSWDELEQIMNQLWAFTNGGSWSVTGGMFPFKDKFDALWNLDKLLPNIWVMGDTKANFDQAFRNIVANKIAQEYDKEEKEWEVNVALRTVNISETYQNENWLIDRQKEAWGAMGQVDYGISRGFDTRENVNKKSGLTLNEYLAVWGAQATALEYGAGATRLASDWTIRTANAAGKVFTGNQAVKTISLAKFGKGLGTAGAVASTAIDAVGVLHGDVNPAKFALNGSMTVAGIWGGPVGVGVSFLYSAIDAYYPGGIEGYGHDLGEKLYDMQMQNPGYRSQQMFP